MLLWYYRPAGTANGKNLRSEPDTPHANYHSEWQYFWEEYGNTPAYVETIWSKKNRCWKRPPNLPEPFPSASPALLDFGNTPALCQRLLYIYARMPSYTSVRIHGTKLSISGNKPLKQAKWQEEDVAAAHNIAVYHEMKMTSRKQKMGIKAQELARKVEKIDDEKKGNKIFREYRIMWWSAFI